jgi:hypothetical protein
MGGDRLVTARERRAKRVPATSSVRSRASGPKRRLAPSRAAVGRRGYFGAGQSLSAGKTNGMTILGSPTGLASGSTGSPVLSPLPGVAKREAAAQRTD